MLKLFYIVLYMGVQMESLLEVVMRRNSKVFLKLTAHIYELLFEGSLGV